MTKWGSTMYKNWAHFYFTKTESHSSNLTSNPVITSHLYSWMDLATYWWESTIVHLITYLFPSSASLPPSLSLPLLKQSSITLSPVILPSISRHLPGPSSRVVPSGCSGATQPPLPCQSTQLCETDSSTCKSIIIFRQCNPIPEDIL